MTLFSRKFLDSDEWRYRISRHAIFWLIYLVAYSFIGGGEAENWGSPTALAIRWMPNTVFTTYISLWLVERFLLKARYRSFIVLCIAWLPITIFCSYITHLYLVYPYCWDPGPRPSFRGGLSELFDIYPIFVSAIILGALLFLRMYKFWRGEMLQKLQLRQEKTDAELELLKAQLHPHFLFNTLNNLYSLILEKSARAPEMLMRLSGILSYVLNDCQAAEVPLEDEVAFCQDYIELECERYGDRLDVVTRFTGDFEGKMVTPMLFQPFIENAFKHGAAELVGKVWMNIALTVDDHQLLFRVVNSADRSAQRSLGREGGIGIANIVRRLQLLYPGRHKFIRNQDERIHSISLTIELTPASHGIPRRVRKQAKEQDLKVGATLVP
jgi:Histidine kinase